MVYKIKKSVSIMLAVLIAVSLFAIVPFTASADDDSFTVNLTSNLFTPGDATYYYSSDEGVPDTVTVTYYMDVDRALKLQAIQIHINFDTAYLTFDPAKNGNYDEYGEEYNFDSMFPVSNGVGDVDPWSGAGLIKFAAAKWDGLDLKKGGELVPIAKVTFDVVEGAKGGTDVDASVKACALTNPKTEEDYIVYNVNGLQQGAYDFVTGGDPSALYTVIEPEGNEPGEVTTAPEETTAAPEETTVAPEETTVEGEATTGSTQETTEAPGGDLTVDGTSNYCASVTAQTVAPGQSVTVSFKAPEDRDIVDIQWGMNYDKDLLQLTGISTFDGGAMLINTNGDTYNVIGSLTDITNPYQVTAGSDFITFVFEAKAPGTTTVDLRISDMTVRTDDGDVIIFENEEDKRQDEPTEETTAPEEETTVEGEETTGVVEETTEAPEETTAPVEETTAPAEETTAPAEETTAPAEETTAPVEETTAPVEETTAPEEGTTGSAEEGTTTSGEEGTTVPDGEGTTSADDTAGTSSTDATSATGGSSTSDQSTPDNGIIAAGSDSGFVQTGNASMAIIILLVLLSATVGIWFARRKVD